MAVQPLPVEIIATANQKSRRLRELVLAPEILVMPGAWDPLSAILFEHLGFQAIQGSSAAIAATLGLRDGELITREQTVTATRDIADAVSVPVNADGEAGYGGPDDAAATVRGFVEAGAAGMNLEDSIPSEPTAVGRGLASIKDQIEKIAAVMEAKRALGSEFFLNARIDAFAIMREDPKAALAEAIRRGNAYAEVGADCIFYLGVSGRDTIATLVKEVAAPVSIFAVADTPSVAELQELGVARVSYGSAFQRAALAAIKRFAERIRGPDGHAQMREVMSGRGAAGDAAGTSSSRGLDALSPAGKCTCAPSNSSEKSNREAKQQKTNQYGVVPARIVATEIARFQPPQSHDVSCVVTVHSGEQSHNPNYAAKDRSRRTRNSADKEGSGEHQE